MISHDRIIECKNMINILKLNAKGIPTRKQTTVIKSVSVDSFNFVMDEILKILDGDLTKVEIIEVHTFAKPNDVSDIDFPSVSSEDK